MHYLIVLLGLGKVTKGHVMLLASNGDCVLSKFHNKTLPRYLAFGLKSDVVMLLLAGLRPFLPEHMLTIFFA